MRRETLRRLSGPLVVPLIAGACLVAAMGAPALATSATSTATGAVSGTVTAHTGGHPLSGICVRAVSSVESVSAHTSIKGSYKITNLAPGSYSINFSVGCGNTGNFLPATRPGKVKVISRKTVSGLNMALLTGGEIEGSVTTRTGGQVLSGICVTAFRSGAIGAATTGSKGTFAITRLTPGSYAVSFSGCGSTIEYGYQTFTDPTKVKVGIATTTMHINAKLTATRGVISGSVTDSSTHARVSGICVYLYTGSNGPGQPTTTAMNGTYSIESVPPGSYTVNINGGSYGCGNTSKYPYLSSTIASITVTAGHLSTVNSSLVAGGAIGGTVTSQQTGAVLPGICVIISGGVRGSVYTITDNNGTYSVGSAPDTYSVTFSTTEPGGSHPSCGTTGVYANQTNASVVVTSDATTNLDAALAP